ncbi:MAG: PIN domain-containing protein [Blastochloris sp.]|nr:PIN domain-containing protein [Blastochloris sp.]
MNSLDTNVLIYAINSGCVEHNSAKQLYEAMLREPTQWILSDQILFEFYRRLQNSKILERPLNQAEALRQITFLREESGVQHCAYETGFWRELILGISSTPRKSTHIFDRVLAITLRRNGVKTFYTRNVGDFQEFGFASLVNPIDSHQSK